MKAKVTVARAPADVIEVLDRVLDRGIVIDAWLRVSLVGLTLVDVDARVVVASIHTYVRDGEAIANHGAVARPSARAEAAQRPAPPPPPVKRAKRARPARQTAKIMLRCAQGCTFLRASRRSPVQCSSDRARRCAVTAVG